MMNNPNIGERQAKAVDVASTYIQVLIGLASGIIAAILGIYPNLLTITTLNFFSLQLSLAFFGFSTFAGLAGLGGLITMTGRDGVKIPTNSNWVMFPTAIQFVLFGLGIFFLLFLIWR
jgi:hypothetical protein